MAIRTLSAIACVFPLLSGTALANSSSLSSTTASSQASSQTPSTAPANVSSVVSSSAPTNSNNPIPQQPEYSFAYPANSPFVHTIVNYKDSINLVWDVTWPYNSPELSIKCWKRTDKVNDTAGPIQRKPDLAASLVKLTNGQQDYNVSFTGYSTFSPCQFFLTDSTNDTLTRGVVQSAMVDITDDEKAPPKGWDQYSEAPVSNNWLTSGVEGLGAPGKYTLLMGLGGLLAMGMSLM